MGLVFAGLVDAQAPSQHYSIGWPETPRNQLPHYQISRGTWSLLRTEFSSYSGKRENAEHVKFLCPRVGEGEEEPKPGAGEERKPGKCSCGDGEVKGELTYGFFRKCKSTE